MAATRRKFLGMAGKGVVGMGMLSTSGLTLSSTGISQEAEKTTYGGPLEGFTLTDRKFDTLDFSREMYDSTPRSLEFKARSPEEASEWQKVLRAKIMELVGGLTNQRCPLNAYTLERKEFPEYTREKVVFQSRPNMTVFGYFIVPAKYKVPGPVMICLPGHGRGVDDIVGIREDATYRTDRSGYMHDFALQAVENGFAALAIEQFAFGCRRDKTARSKNPGTSSCMPSAGAAFLFGQTMVGWRVYDVMRSIDYLETRSEIDPQRIGVMGISGGGTITFFSTAIDTRLKVGYVSGYFNLFRDCIMSLPHCIDNYVPGILNYAEMYDIAGLIPPRAMFVESGTKDTIFPVEATKESFTKAKKIFEFFNAGDKIDMEIFEDEHTFYGRKGFQFLMKWL